MNCSISDELNMYIESRGYQCIDYINSENINGILVIGSDDVMGLYNKIANITEFIPIVVAYVGNNVSSIHKLFYENIGINLLKDKTDDQIKIAIDHLFDYLI